MSEVVITIDQAGSAKVEVNGVCGPGCEDLTRAIEQSMGARTKNQRKMEYMLAPQAENSKIEWTNFSSNNGAST